MGTLRLAFCQHSSTFSYSQIFTKRIPALHAEAEDVSIFASHDRETHFVYLVSLFQLITNTAHTVFEIVEIPIGPTDVFLVSEPAIN